MALLTRDQFIAATRSKTSTVRIDALDQDVSIRSLYGSEQERFADIKNELGDSPGLEDLYRKLIAPTVACGLVGEDGKRIFGDGPEDIDELLKFAPAALAEMATKIAQFSGLSPGAVAEAKNASSSDQSAASPSA